METVNSIPRYFRAPGRVNLIGEHTDYNDGFVLPVAIGLYTTLRLELSCEQLEHVQWRATSQNAVGQLRYTPGSSAQPSGEWFDHVLGVALALQRRGIKIPGASLHFMESVPLGAGLSSSAALEVCAALAFLAAAQVTLEPMEIARACQEAETLHAGLQCGIMDHFIALHARPGHAMLLDCQSLSYQAIALPPGIALVAANTNVQHELSASAYNQRQAECTAAAKAMGLTSLRDAQSVDETLEPLLRKRSRHVITENQRVLAFVDALRQYALRQDARADLGRLMAESHASLRDDFEVSCPELDLMVSLATQLPGCIGARMTGGGFGGSTVNLVAAEQAEAFCEQLSQRYEKQCGVSASLYLVEAQGPAEEFHP